MRIRDLDQLFLDELKDAYDFEHQIIAALPKMARAAHDRELQKGFESHLEQTRRQVELLERVFASLGEKPSRKTCKGMKGLLREGNEVVGARGDESAVDAALIAAAQRVEHYEIAAYGTLRTYARTLGREEDAGILQQILDQEAATDERLTRLAESRINERAREADGVETNGQSSRRSRGGSRGSATNGQTKAQLYARAKRLGIEGRSAMSKGELERAIARQG